MTGESQLERGLTALFQSDAPVHAPIDLHAAAMAQVAQRRQRPAFLVLVGGDAFPAATTRIGSARTLVLIGVVLMLAAIGTLLVVAALPDDDGPTTSAGWITFVDSSTAPAYAIWRVRADGTGAYRIGAGECPSVSTDGTSMVFIAGRSGDVKGQTTAARSDGSNQRVLVSIEAFTADVSPDGLEVLWPKSVGPAITSADGSMSMGSQSELWITPISDGQGLLVVPRPSPANVQIHGQTWSPSGDRIAFVQSAITFDGGRPVADEAIWVVNADGSDLHLVASVSTATWISWSPDGRWLAYVGDLVTNPQVRVLAVDGSVETVVAPASQVQPNWSPDGRYLSYWDEFGISTLEMSDGLPVGEPNRLQPSTDHLYTFQPLVWSPDGRRLLIVETRRVGSGSRPENFATRLFTVDAKLRGPTTLILDRGRINDFSSCPIIWRP